LRIAEVRNNTFRIRCSRSTETSVKNEEPRRAEVRCKKTAALQAATVGDEELQVQPVLGRGVDFYSLIHGLAQITNGHIAAISHSELKSIPFVRDQQDR
jgi:hypothetical protein